MSSLRSTPNSTDTGRTTRSRKNDSLLPIVIGIVGYIGFIVFKLLEPRKNDPAELFNLQLQVFDKFDSDKDGRLNETEFGMFLSSLATTTNMKQPTQEEIRNIFMEKDGDRDGLISFDEFISNNPA